MAAGLSPRQQMWAAFTRNRTAVAGGGCALQNVHEARPLRVPAHQRNGALRRVADHVAGGAETGVSRRIRVT